MHEVMCPVCGRKITDQLPTAEDVFNEEFRFSRNFCITDSVVVVRWTFDHARDEDDDFLPLEVPHPVTAVISMLFDSEGKCVLFCIQDLVDASCPGQVNDVKEVTM